MFAAKNELLTRPNGGYKLTRSLRFRSSASASLTRTPATASNRKTWTWSGWVKRGTLSTYQNVFGATTGGYPFLLRFDNDNTLFVYQDGVADYGGNTSAVYRDPAAWYHIVLAIDTTQATDTNRLKLYINGVQVSVNPTYGYFALNVDTSINSTGVHSIGGPSANYFDGYMAEVNFIDGQALDPTAFGAFSIYNQWLPKKYAGTYGTNGFYLPFTNNASAATLGNDFSGNSNTWTTNNISVTAGSTYDSMTDVPTLTSATAANFATLNPLQLSASGSPVTSNGNLRLSSSASGYPQAGCTFGTAINGFKGYFEVTLTGGNDIQVGFNYASAAITNTDYTSTGCIYVNGTGNLFNSSATVVQSSYITAPSTGGVIMIAFDFTGSNKNIWWGYNGTWGTRGGVGNPATGANPGITVTEMTSVATRLYLTTGGGASTPDYNFGQQPFAYTPPTGYLALNTFNL